MKHIVSCLILFTCVFWASHAFADDGIKDRLNACKERLNDEFNAIQETLEAENVPREFVYLMCAESTGDTSTCSDKGACGLWQLMPTTARRFGVVVNKKQDERLDAQKATKAAASYIGTLLDMFDGEVLWAVAAYNTGGHNLSRAVQYTKGMKVRVIRDYFPQAYNLVYTFQRMREMDSENKD